MYGREAAAAAAADPRTHGSADASAWAARVAEAVRVDREGLACGELARMVLQGLVSEGRYGELYGSVLRGLDGAWWALRESYGRQLGGGLGHNLEPGATDLRRRQQLATRLWWHRAATRVALAVMGPCAAGELRQHAAVRGMAAAMGPPGGGGGAGAWEERQGCLKLLEGAVAGTAADAAALMRQEEGLGAMEQQGGGGGMDVGQQLGAAGETWPRSGPCLPRINPGPPIF